ncbi:IS1634 family transposase [Frankia sp. B2]|uniref:IS1634 family transposase n=1 Tax=Frankia sp. B2 TaxID=2541730 RepID=UPI00106AFCD5|nr:IS1634 family transposase [Frankia sp. B2]TFE31019.1 IS1634 family transposase [Frankia sp. B2]
MASIIKKRIAGRTYLYAGTSVRVDGQPRIVDQIYLGPEDEVIALLAGQAGGGDPMLPDATEHRRFGDVAAVWAMLTRIDAAGIIDAAVGGAKVSGETTAGTYLTLAALNRICDPCSKARIAGWYSTTPLRRITGIPVRDLDHHRFWDAMDRVDLEKVDAIETALTRRMIEVFGLDTSALILDMTNFATFIDSTNTRAPVAARGKAKQKRYDLRLIGLGLVATRDGGIPLLSRVYQGSQPDVTQFTPMIRELARRYADAVDAPRGLTLTFDPGQNSTPNFAELAALRLHFVGSVPPSDLPDLLARPAGDRSVVTRYADEGLTALDTRATVLGAERRVILTHSPGLHTAQQVGFAQTLAKTTSQLDELAARLARGKTRRARGPVEADIADFLAPRWVARVLRTELTGDTPATFRLAFAHDQAAQQSLEEELFGKWILVTDHDDWPVDQVIDAYRSQEDLEAGFRQAKDPHVVSFGPIHHFTDHKIRIHLFTCVLALSVAHLMRREADRAGLRLSVPALLGELEGIGETVLLYQGERGRPRARQMLTRLSPLQQQLHHLFDLGQYTPRR